MQSTILKALAPFPTGPFTEYCWPTFQLCALTATSHVCVSFPGHGITCRNRLAVIFVAMISRHAVSRRQGKRRRQRWLDRMEDMTLAERSHLLALVRDQYMRGGPSA